MPETESEDKRRKDMIAVAAHELRNPIAAILGALDLLMDSKVLGEELPPKTRGIVEMMFNTSKRMLRLLNDYLDLEKMESTGAGMRQSPIDVGAVVRQVVEMNRPLARQRGIELVIDESEPGLRALSSSDRLAQVVTNLLSNAVKFTRDKTVVSIRVARVADHIRISVDDQGPGISEEFQSRIFQKFAQDPNIGRKIGGSGLGLAISRAIVERMGGRIGFETRTGQGTTFYFEIPNA